MSQSGISGDREHSRGITKSNPPVILPHPVIQMYRLTGSNAALVGRVSHVIQAPRSLPPRIVGVSHVIQAPRSHPPRTVGVSHVIQAPRSHPPRIIRQQVRFCSMQNTAVRQPHSVYIVSSVQSQGTNKVNLSHEPNSTKMTAAGSSTLFTGEPHQTTVPLACFAKNERQKQQVIKLEPMSEQISGLPGLSKVKKNFVTKTEKDGKNNDMQGTSIVNTTKIHAFNWFPKLVSVQKDSVNAEGSLTREMKVNEELLSDVKVERQEPGSSESVYTKSKTGISNARGQLPSEIKLVTTNKRNVNEENVFTFSDEEVTIEESSELPEIGLASGMRLKTENCQVEYLEEPEIGFALSEDATPLSVSIFDTTTIADASAIAKTKCNSKRKKTNSKKTAKPKQITEEEKQKRKEARMKSQYASWTDKPTVNYSELLESDVESDHSSDSDFLADHDEEESSDSSFDEEEEDMFENIEESDAEQAGVERKSMKPAVKDGTVFSLELIAEILQTTVDQLNSERWTEDMVEVDDKRLFREMVNLGKGLRRYKCYICGIQVHGTSENMENHMHEVHGDAPLGFGCFFCPLARPTEKHLTIHENVHTFWHPKGICTICDVSHRPTTDIDWPSLHRKCHPDLNEVRQWKPEQQVKVYEYCHAPNCTATPDPFVNILRFSAHAAIYHVGGTGMCEFCGKGGMSVWGLRRHRDVCRRKKEGRKVCKICGMERKDMVGHNCSGKFDCKLCGAKFTHYQGRKRHTQNVHGGKNYTCEVCGKSFAEKKILMDHMNTHTGAKPYHCLACGGWYTSQAGLAMHLRSRHNLTTTQMREKYKLSPFSKPGETENEKEDEEKVNKYTGRKRGRPKVRKSNMQEEEKDGCLELEDAKDTVPFDPTAVRKSGDDGLPAAKRQHSKTAQKNNPKRRKRNTKKKENKDCDESPPSSQED